MGNERLLIAEQMVDQLDVMPHVCENKVRGCTTLSMKSELKPHEDECQFRKVLCPEYLCTDADRVFIATELLEHVANEHPDAKKHLGSYYEGSWDELDLYYIHLKERDYDWMHMEAFGRHFFPSFNHFEGGGWNFEVTFFGSRQEAKKFSYRYKLYHPDNTSQEHLLTVDNLNMYRNDEEMEEIIVNDKLKFSVEIIQNVTWQILQIMSVNI